MLSGRAIVDRGRAHRADRAELVADGGLANIAITTLARPSRSLKAGYPIMRARPYPMSTLCKGWCTASSGASPKRSGRSLSASIRSTCPRAMLTPQAVRPPNALTLMTRPRPSPWQRRPSHGSRRNIARRADRGDPGLHAPSRNRARHLLRLARARQRPAALGREPDPDRRAFPRSATSTLLQELQQHWKSDVFPTMLPVSPEEFEEMRAWNALVREAAERGLRLYVAPDEEEPSP